MREIVESYHAQLLSKNSNFAKPRVIPSLEADYDIRPLPSSSPSAAVASILSSLDSDPTSLNIASSATREDMSTLVSLVSARDAGKISSLTCTELDVPPSDLARLISLLPNLGRAEMGSVKSLTNDFVHFLAITCPKLTFVGLRGHADEHSALTESVLTSLSQAIEGCEVDVRDQFWLGREFVAGTAFDLWKGRGGGKLHVGEGGEYVEL